MHVTHKFAPHAKHYVFLGYLADKKAYNIFDFHAHKIFISRDVVFHENIFPYESSHTAFINNNFVLPHTIITPLIDLVTQPLDQYSEHPYLIPDSPSLAPLRHSQCHCHPSVALHGYVYNQVTSPNHLSSPSSSSYKGTHFPLAILFLIIVTHRNIIPSSLPSIKMLRKHLMPKQLVISIGKRQCNLNWML